MNIMMVIFIHHIGDIDKWAIDDGGASYIQEGLASSSRIPNDDNFIDYTSIII